MGLHGLLQGMLYLLPINTISHNLTEGIIWLLVKEVIHEVSSILEGSKFL
jgi:hypothetical protein